MNKLKEVISKMGPGLLMAGAAIGVSHLVQSTRAGASFGFQLVVIVLLANLLKYPFFEFGHRFSVATGHNLLFGYRQIGKGFLYAFLVLNLLTAVGTMAGVTFVTGALAYNMFGGLFTVPIWCGIVLLICGLILVIGHYKFLDSSMKLLMLMLFVATLVAFVAAIIRGPVAPIGFAGESAFSWKTIPFLVALMGWMPAPVETSVWTSLWVLAKNRDSRQKMTWAEAKLDFNFGYFSTTALAIVFLLLGAFVMYGSGTSFSDSSGDFASQVISLYTQNLGEWSRPIIAFAAFATMFSTTLTCLDAYPRSLTAATELCWENRSISSPCLAAWLQPKDRRTYYAYLLWSAGTGLIVIIWFSQSFKLLVDFVTISAFLTAPIFALMNYKLIFSKHLPVDYKPGAFMKILCWIGLTYLIGFGLFFIYYKLV